MDRDELSQCSRARVLQGSLLLTTMFPGVPGTHLINLN